MWHFLSLAFLYSTWHSWEWKRTGVIAVEQGTSAFCVTNIPLVIFVPTAIVTFGVKVIIILLIPVALILGLVAKLLHTQVCNSPVLSKLKMRQAGFPPSLVPPAQNYATGTMRGLLTSAHEPKAIIFLLR